MLIPLLVRFATSLEDGMPFSYFGDYAQAARRLPTPLPLPRRSKDGKVPGFTTSGGSVSPCYAWATPTTGLSRGLGASYRPSLRAPREAQQRQRPLLESANLRYADLERTNLRAAYVRVARPLR